MRIKKCFKAVAFAAMLAMPAMAFADSQTQPLPPGFIALSESTMNWKNAEAFCQQQGGRLPLIGGSSRRVPWHDATPVDGFGSLNSPWPSGLRYVYYWSGTDLDEDSGFKYRIYGGARIVSVSAERSSNSSTARAICVPK